LFLTPQLGRGHAGEARQRHLPLDDRADGIPVDELTAKSRTARLTDAGADESVSVSKPGDRKVGGLRRF
jgi:hypothetical protein